MSFEDAQYYISETREFVPYSTFKKKNINQNAFYSFRTRMWLDHCDENNTIISQRMSFPRYCKEYNDWLHEKYEETLT